MFAGNAQPDADLAALVPIGGGGYDLIVVCMQRVVSGAADYTLLSPKSYRLVPKNASTR